MPENTSRDDALSQLDKFKQAARELETDDDEKRFKDRLGKLVKAPPTKADASGGQPKRS